MCARSNVLLATLEECHHCNSARLSGDEHDALRGGILSHSHPIEVNWRKDRDALIRDGIVEIRPALQ